jgi:hypothetical protein
MGNATSRADMTSTADSAYSAKAGGLYTANCFSQRQYFYATALARRLYTASGKASGDPPAAPNLFRKVILRVSCGWRKGEIEFLWHLCETKDSTSDAPIFVMWHRIQRSCGGRMGGKGKPECALASRFPGLRVEPSNKARYLSVSWFGGCFTISAGTSCCFIRLL